MCKKGKIRVKKQWMFNTVNKTQMTPSGIEKMQGIFRSI